MHAPAGEPSAGGWASRIYWFILLPLQTGPPFFFRSERGASLFLFEGSASQSGRLLLNFLLDGRRWLNAPARTGSPMMPSAMPRLSWSPKLVAGVFEALSISPFRAKGSPRHDSPITTTPTNSGTKRWR